MRHGATGLLAISVLLLIGIASSAAPADTLPELKDQFGGAVSLAQAGNQPQVAIVVSGNRLNRLEDWDNALQKAFPDLPIIRIADLPKESADDYGEVSGEIREKLPPSIRVGLDLGGHWAAQFDLNTKVPNILLFDASGRLVARHAAKFKDDEFPPVRDDVARLLAADSGDTR